MSLDERARVHSALGDARRLAIADRLAIGDCTVAELAAETGLAGNLLAHHLDILENAGLIRRGVSEGDRRRKYVSLRRERAPRGLLRPSWKVEEVAFVCTHNSARSQFAAAMWEQTTGLPAGSGGSDPASEVHPGAIQVAAEFGVDISTAEPGGYELIGGALDLVVSVCDRAREGGVPAAAVHAHWSVPDPVVVGTPDAFRSAFEDIAGRVEHLLDLVEGPGGPDGTRSACSTTRR